MDHGPRTRVPVRGDQTMDDLNGAVAEMRPEPKRDRYGRYLIPHPDTGKETAWTRATTFAKTVSDTFGLTKWELRMVSLGLAKRPDLLAQVAGVLDPADRDPYSAATAGLHNGPACIERIVTVQTYSPAGTRARLATLDNRLMVA